MGVATKASKRFDSKQFDPKTPFGTKQWTQQIILEEALYASERACNHKI